MSEDDTPNSAPGEAANDTRRPDIDSPDAPAMPSEEASPADQTLPTPAPVPGANEADATMNRHGEIGAPGTPAATATTCMNCAYDVRGVSAEGACPECGLSVAVSVQLQLRAAPHSWINRLIIGGWTIVFALVFVLFFLVMMFVALFLSAGFGSPAPMFAILGLQFVAITLVYGGVVTMSLRDPNEAAAEVPRLKRARGVRLLAMGFAIAGYGTFIAVILAGVVLSQIDDMNLDYEFGIAFGIFMAVAYFLGLILTVIAFLSHVRHLGMIAWRIPAPGLVKQFRVIYWCTLAASAFLILITLLQIAVMAIMTTQGGFGGAPAPVMTAVAQPNVTRTPVDSSGQYDVAYVTTAPSGVEVTVNLAVDDNQLVSLKNVDSTTGPTKNAAAPDPPAWSGHANVYQTQFNADEWQVVVTLTDDTGAIDHTLSFGGTREPTVTTSISTMNAPSKTAGAMMAASAFFSAFSCLAIVMVPVMAIWYLVAMIITLRRMTIIRNQTQLDQPPNWPMTSA